ncbi:hypothetical protein D3C87_2141470 [compost metagenome]
MFARVHAAQERVEHLLQLAHVQAQPVDEGEQDARRLGVGGAFGDLGRGALAERGQGLKEDRMVGRQ